MKVTREQAAANREKIVEVASTLFRKHGFDGIGVADIMKAAGLTHGGFYGHFESKDDLAAEACARALSREWWKEAIASSTAGGLETIVTAYLSPQHRSNRARGCLFAAVGSDGFCRRWRSQSAGAGNADRPVRTNRALTSAAIASASSRAMFPRRWRQCRVLSEP